MSKREQRFEQQRLHPWRWALLDSAGIIVGATVVDGLFLHVWGFLLWWCVGALALLPVRAWLYRTGWFERRWRRRHSGSLSS